MQTQFVAGRRRRPTGTFVASAILAVAALLALTLSGALDAQAPLVVEPPSATAPEPVAVAPSPSPVAAPPAPEPSIPPPPAGRDALVQQLEGLLAAPGVGGTLAVTVIDEHGRSLIDRHGDVALLPASTLKLVTAAAALENLGPDHRFRTTVEATATPVYGVLPGDLVLVGSGDPALASPLYGRMVYPARPRTPLEQLADRVVALGITRVQGTVVGEPRAFPTAAAPSGWFPRYYYDFDARIVSSLTAEAGLEVAYDEEADDLEILLSDDPVVTAARVLRDLLVERGVEVVGEPRSAGVDEPDSYELGAVESPPLAVLLEHTVQRSDNHMADTVLHAVGAAVEGEGTWVAGERAARRTLVGDGLDWARTRLVDGSGLSRDDRSDTRFLAALERIMYGSEHATTWRSLMAVAGSEGTLRARLRGTPAEGRLTGKTGTLDDVRALAGTVHGPGGRRYHLAVIGNDLTDGDSRVNIRTLIDNLALALSADLYGCTETTPPYEPAVQPSPAPRTWACPTAPEGTVS